MKLILAPVQGGRTKLRMSSGKKSLAARISVFFGLCLFVWFSAAMLHASDYFVYSWQVEDGLTQNSVTAIVQSQDGYLWLGTYSGLARFDGVRFTLFDENNTPEMHNSRVTSLFEANDRTLWIGHENGDVTRYKDGIFQAVDYKATWSGGKISDIGTDESGDVWIFNEEGLAARLRDGLVLTPPPGGATKLVNVARSPGGHLWIARDGRVSELVQGRWRVLPFTEANANTYVLGIGASSDGGLWVAVDNRLRKWKDDHWVAADETAWMGTPMTRLMELRNGSLAAGTSDHGLNFIFPRDGGKRTPFDHAGGFPSDWIVSLCEDREGNLWVGTGGAGLVMMRKNVIQTVEPPDHWQGRAVLTAHTGHDRALWAGTEGAGLYQFQNGAWKNFGPAEGLYNPYVWSIAAGNQDELWVGTWGSGLFVQREGGHFTNAPGFEQTPLVMPALFYESPEKLWLGTGEGLMLYDSGKTTRFGKENDTLRKIVRTVIKDSSGTVWFGMAGGGLGCLSNGTLKQFRKSDGLASDYVECLHPDGDAFVDPRTFRRRTLPFETGPLFNYRKKSGTAQQCHLRHSGGRSWIFLDEFAWRNHSREQSKIEPLRRWRNQGTGLHQLWFERRDAHAGMFRRPWLPDRRWTFMVSHDERPREPRAARCENQSLAAAGRNRKNARGRPARHQWHFHHGFVGNSPGPSSF